LKEKKEEKENRENREKERKFVIKKIKLNSSANSSD
jgi:hypothetical protein